MNRVTGSAVALLLAGCTGESPPSGVERIDSAGVELVTNLVAPADLPLSILNTQPVLRIETDEEAGPVLFGVRSLALFANGNLAVASNGTQSVVIFDTESNVVAEFGREGTGPGEFDAIEGLVTDSDSLFVYDPSLRRLTVFSKDGALVRTVDLTDVSPSGWSELLPLDDGLVIFGQGGMNGRRELGSYRLPSPSRRIDRDGATIASYGEFPGVEIVISKGGMGLLPFGARVFGATYANVLVIGPSERPEIMYYDGSAALTRIVRWPDHQRAVSQERFDEYLDSQLENVPQDQRAGSRALLEGLSHADLAPPYQDLLATDRGNVWIGDYPGAEALRPGGSKGARIWLVVGPEGQLQERVQTPAGFRPHIVTGDRVFGVYTDEFGVESVRAYQLVP